MHAVARRRESDGGHAPGKPSCWTELSPRRSASGKICSLKLRGNTTDWSPARRDRRHDAAPSYRCKSGMSPKILNLEPWDMIYVELAHQYCRNDRTADLAQRQFQPGNDPEPNLHRPTCRHRLRQLGLL